MILIEPVIFDRPFFVSSNRVICLNRQVDYNHDFYMVLQSSRYLTSEVSFHHGTFSFQYAVTTDSRLPFLSFYFFQIAPGHTDIKSPEENPRADGNLLLITLQRYAAFENSYLAEAGLFVVGFLAAGHPNDLIDHFL